MIFACINSLTFWSSFIKAISMLGDKDMQTKLYSSSEVTRGTVSTIIGFISVAFTGLVTTNVIFNANNGYSVFLILIFYSSLYFIIAILGSIFIPGPWKENYVKRKINNKIHYKPKVIDKEFIFDNEEDYKVARKKIHNNVLKKSWNRFQTIF